MKRIIELRQQKGLNQIGLALKLNVSQKMISAYERGVHQPSINTLKELSRIFDVSVDYIIENSDVKVLAEKFMPNNISEDEVKLLDMFKQLPRKKQHMALGIIYSLSKLDE